VESGNDYVIQVKGNAKKLYTSIKAIIAMDQFVATFERKETNKGRKEKRVCKVYKIKEAIPEYESAKTIIYMEHSGIRNGKEYSEVHYYITNKENHDAKHYLKHIRGHWQIENNLHWVKDVILNEDNSKIRDFALAENMSIVRNMVINVFRLNDIPSITQAIERYCNRLVESITLVNELRIEKL